MERESMEFDVVIVGAGRSGLSTVIAKVFRACSERHGDNEMRSGHLSAPDLCCTKTALAFAFIALVGYHVVAGAQQVGGAVNPSVPEVVPAAERKLRLDYSVTPIALRIVLPPADTATKRSAAGMNRSRPLQIGFHRAMPDKFQGDLSPRLDWVDMGDGSIVAALSVTSPEASAMRMGIRAELPEGGEIRFFDGQTDQGHDDPGFPVIGWDDLHLKDERPAIPPPPVVKGGATGTDGAPPSRDALPALSLTLKGGSNPEILWSPVVEGDTIGVEITLPSVEARSAFSFGIEKISHIHAPIGSSWYEPRRFDCFTHIDVQCPAARFPRTQANAVASIVFEDDERTLLCTGTLLNDKAESTFIPYFLTAHHCVPTEEVARTVEAWWFYQRETCGRVEIDDRYSVTHGGAHLLATSLDQDSTLLRLEGSLPGGVSFSGWSAEPIDHPAAVYGLHHPDGQVMKYAAGITLGQQDVPITNLGTVVNAIVVRWNSGATERGSSGSGLFDDLLLIGSLSAGTNVCEQGLDVYGSLRDFFPQMKRWLDPIFSHAIPFVTPASNLGQEGFVRIVNNSHRAGTVSIHAIDDDGERFGPVTLSLDAKEAKHFNSGDLEDGNSSKGLSGGVGDGSGHWRLELTTELEIETSAYIRTADGFLTSIHEMAAEVEADDGAEEGTELEGAAVRYYVPIFNPGSNGNQESWLRLINPGDHAAAIAIDGTDDGGEPAPEGEVRLTLAAGAARMLTAVQLEQGDTDFDGRFGDGTDKWRLSVSADRPIQVMSLMQSPTGHLTNLSR